MKVLFCNGLLVIMPIGVASVQTQQFSVNPLDGGLHRITLVGDGQNLRLYVDGQGGLEYPYNYYLKSFLLGYSDIGSEEQFSDSLLRFDNLTLSVPSGTAPAAPSGGIPISDPNSPPITILGTLWTQTFDDPANWAQTGVKALPGEVKDGVYVMPITAMQARYRDGSTLVENIISETSLLSYELSFDFQSEGSDLASECGLIVVNAETEEEARALFCHDSLSIMLTAHNPFEDAAGSTRAVASPIDPMDGAVHRISLVADSQHLRLFVDGQGGVRFPYTVPLTSFLLGHIDTRLTGDETQGKELAHFDNMTLSRAQECALIITVTMIELVVEPIDAIQLTGSVDVDLRYGIGYIESVGDPAPKPGLWEVAYDAALTVGDRVTGFPSLTRTVRCAGQYKGGYYRANSGDTYLSDGSVFIQQNRLSMFPVRESKEFVSAPTSRRYRVTYTVAVERLVSEDDRVNTESIDLSTIRVEHH